LYFSFAHVHNLHFSHTHTCTLAFLALSHTLYFSFAHVHNLHFSHTHTHTHTHTCTLAFLALTHTLYHLYFFLSELNNRSFSCFLSHSHTLQVHKLYEDSILQSTVLRLTEDEDAVPGVRVSHVPLSHFLSHSLLFPSWCASRPFLYLPRLAFPLLRVVGLLTRCHEMSVCVLFFLFSMLFVCSRSVRSFALSLLCVPPVPPAFAC
jgi:hypothetical protein